MLNADAQFELIGHGVRLVIRNIIFGILGVQMWRSDDPKERDEAVPEVLHWVESSLGSVSSMASAGATLAPTPDAKLIVLNVAYGGRLMAFGVNIGRSIYTGKLQQVVAW